MAKENDELADELAHIIREGRLHALFQPIANLRQASIYGFEALIRGPSDSALHSPVTLFDTATRCGRLFELELLCREAAITAFRELELPGRLFLNATPSSLLEPDHRPGRTLATLQKHGLRPQQVVIELTEQHPMDDYDLMRQATEHYRSMGFSIAIDDLGAGYAGLRMWSELRPDFVKIDRHFVENIHEDKVKREFVRSIMDIAQGLGCGVIAEGMETAAEYEAVRRLGIPWGQGYYFARPHRNPPAGLQGRLFTHNPSHAEEGDSSNRGQTVRELVEPAPQVSAQTSVVDALTVLFGSPELDSLVVVNADRRPTGLVSRYALKRAFRGESVDPAYLPVGALTDAEPLVCLDHAETLESAALRVAACACNGRVPSQFVITEEERLLGLGHTRDLLYRLATLLGRQSLEPPHAPKHAQGSVRPRGTMPPAPAPVSRVGSGI